MLPRNREWNRRGRAWSDGLSNRCSRADVIEVLKAVACVVSGPSRWRARPYRVELLEDGTCRRGLYTRIPLALVAATGSPEYTRE